MVRIRGLRPVLFIYVIFFTAMALRAWWDFTHPKVWEHPGDDPVLYSWAVGLAFVVTLYVFGYIYVCEWKEHRRKEKVAWLLKRVEVLLSERRTQEAETLLNECKALTNFKG